MKAKPLDEFDLKCLMAYFGAGLHTDLQHVPNSTAEERRLRRRVCGFVLSHPSVTPALRRSFMGELRGKR